MTDFDFSAAFNESEAYHPSTTSALPQGNYVVKIIEIENTTSSGGWPMLRVTLENEQGRQWDNLVISQAQFSIDKVVGLITSAGLSAPQPGVDFDTSNGRLTDEFVFRLQDRSVGLVVRDEEDNRPDHAGEVRPRVKGYVPPSDIKSPGPKPTPTTASNAGSTTPGALVPDTSLAF